MDTYCSTSCKPAYRFSVSSQPPTWRLSQPREMSRLSPASSTASWPRSCIHETKPDYVLILPWNFAEEVMNQMAAIREWGGRFVVPIPKVAVS